MAFAEEREATVGMTGEIEDHVISGPRLEPIPLTDSATPIVLRVKADYKHGDGYRYHFEYYGLEPDSYNLIDFLRPMGGADSAALAKAEPLEVKIVPVLADDQIQLNLAEPPSIPSLGGYRLWLKVAVGLWIFGLLAILFCRRRKGSVSSEEARAERTFADELRPLVEKAMRGTMSGKENADLERMLLGYWRERLDLKDENPIQALATLRKHEEAGPLMIQLERWLHQPQPESDVDLTKLLEPYRHAAAGSVGDSGKESRD